MLSWRAVLFPVNETAKPLNPKSYEFCSYRIWAIRKVWKGFPEKYYQRDGKENNGDDNQHGSHGKDEVHSSLQLLGAFVTSIRRAAPVTRGAYGEKGVEANRHKKGKGDIILGTLEKKLDAW